MWLISRKLCRFLIMFSTSFTSLSIYFFFLYQSPSSLCIVFDSISSLQMCLSLETLKSIIRTGSPILVEFIDLVKSSIIFLSQSTLLRWLTFLLGSSESCCFGFISFSGCQYLFYNGFPSVGKFWSCGCLSSHWLSNKLKTGCLISLHSLCLFSCWLGWSSWSLERCSTGGYL